MEDRATLLCLFMLLRAPCFPSLEKELLEMEEEKMEKEEEEEEDSILQTPLSLTVRTGDTFNLSCRLIWRQAAQLHTLVFLWEVGNQTYSRVASSTPEEAAGGKSAPLSLGRDGKVSVRADLGARASWLVVIDAREQDSGFYRCSVSVLRPLPTLDLSGNGSMVTVQGEEVVLPQSSLQLYGSLLVLALAMGGILIMLTAFILTSKGKCTGAREEVRPPITRDTEENTCHGVSKTMRDRTVYAEIRNALHQVPPPRQVAKGQPQPDTAKEIAYSELVLLLPRATHVPTTVP
ncbi:uncharacterized protein LOC115458084 [Microcaecilia unicolor]|uniref:Uncharacterized protein LOC115458084 n=1 Tax=Microcaecilia unicolor TaxID=1415580 RepID=A0A6P7WKA4_9AMPH|nr:uncharacterized protein LOC115458084 [Microcaecilia unicolor]